MARKGKGPDEAKERELLLAGLRQALDGQARLLQGPAGKGALFAAGRGGGAPAKRAVDEGYLAPSDAPAGLKVTRTVKYVRLTDKGRQFLREQMEPSALLEALLAIVKHLAARMEDTADTLCEVLNVLEGALLAPQEVPLPPDGAPPEEDSSP